MNFKRFLTDNNLRAREIANYLGINEASVSCYVHGKSKPSAKNLNKLVNNPYGWDTSMLMGSEPIVQTHASGDSRVRVAINSHNKTENAGEVEMLRARVADLERQLEEEKKRSAQYWEMIQNLIKK